MNFRIIYFSIGLFVIISFNKEILAKDSNHYESEDLKKMSRKNNSFLISPRLGVDSITDKNGGYFLSAGLDLTWKPAVTYSNILLFPELGIKYLASVNNSSNKNINKVRNIYIFLGLETPKKKNIFTSIRLLTGNETIEFLNPDNNSNQINFGGELKLGYQINNSYEIYGTIGLTQHTQLMAVNFGIVI